jgi:hypothetical protein
MPSLIAYRKHVTAMHTHDIVLPTSTDGEPVAQELATLPDGRTVVALFNGAELDAEAQHAEVASTIEQLPQPLPSDLRDQIREASPHAQLIARRIIERIRTKYSPDDEAYLTRISCGQALGTYQMSAAEVAMLQDYQATAEGARLWAKEERAKLGI